MRKLTYLAVLEPDKKGSYGIYYPDLPGCTSYGKNFSEALKIAEEALGLHIYGMEKDGEELPSPSEISSLPKEDIQGNIIVPITAYPDSLRDRMENKRVKTNCTIPLWLKKAAEEAGLSFSRLLETAIKQELHIL